MDKALRNALIVGILLVGVSAFYYLVIYIPQRDQSRIELQKEDKFKSECIEEKKGMNLQAEAAANQCRGNKVECVASAYEKFGPPADYIQTCMDRKRQGLPTFGY